MVTDTWNIVGRGPSHVKLKMSDLEPGANIAINGAIKHTPIRFDCLSALDAPTGFLKDDGGPYPWLPNPGPLIICPKSRIPAWEKLYPQGELAYFGYHSHRGEFQRRMPWKGGSKNSWLGKSMFVAIAFAAMCRAQRILLYGADMAGVGWVDQPDKAPSWGEERWKDERNQIFELHKELKRHGIELTVMETS